MTMLKGSTTSTWWHEDALEDKACRLHEIINFVLLFLFKISLLARDHILHFNTESKQLNLYARSICSDMLILLEWNAW